MLNCFKITSRVIEVILLVIDGHKRYVEVGGVIVCNMIVRTEV